jgi:hypothetical protein
VSQLDGVADAFRAAGEPLVVEGLAGTLIATWLGDPAIREGRAPRVAEHLLGELERVGAVEALTAVAEVAGGAVAPLAKEAAERVAATDAAAPRWAGQLGVVRCTGVGLIRSPFGDTENWVLGFEPSGDTEESAVRMLPHQMLVTVDRNAMGTITGIAIVPGTGSVDLTTTDPSTWPDATVGAEEPERAARVLAIAAARTEVATGSSLDGEWRGLFPVLRNRLRRAMPSVSGSMLHLAFEADRPSPDTYRDLASRFLASSPGKALAAKLPKADLELAVEELLESTAPGDEPLRWSPLRVLTVLSSYLPSESDADDRTYEAMPEILAALVQWSAAETGLADHLTKQILAEVTDRAEKFRAIPREAEE